MSSEELAAPAPARRAGLRRELTVLGLVATAVCTVIGGGINVLSVEVQGKVPGIGSMVPLAFLLGVVPALFAALAYAVLSSAMPRAGGGYIYASRGLHPFVGFMATFSKWFGLATVIGVIAYLDIALLRDAAALWGLDGVAAGLNTAWGTLGLPLLMIWLFWLINIVGVRTFGITVIILMTLMLGGGLCLIAVGLLNTPERFAEAMVTRGVDVNYIVGHSQLTMGGLGQLVRATGFLFFAYVGFATISQAGGEAREPARALPRAFVIATSIIAGYYVLYAAAFYHAVPWEYVARRVMEDEVTAPGLIGPLLPGILGGVVAFTAAVALANDIPPMLLAVSRLFFAWAEDGIFPRELASVNRRFGTPHWALTVCALLASAVVAECFARPETGFFKGVDMVTMALLLTYLLISAAVITLPRRNPQLYGQVAFIRNRAAQLAVSIGAIVTIGALLAVQVQQDVAGTKDRIAIQRMTFPTEVAYHRVRGDRAFHTWVRLPGVTPSEKPTEDLARVGEVTVGLTGLGVKALPGLSAITLPEVGTTIAARETIGRATFAEGAKPIIAPVDGVITAVNEEAASHPEVVVASPYGAGWLVRVRLEGDQENTHLATAMEYVRGVGGDRPEARTPVGAVVHSLYRSGVVIWLLALLVGAVIFGVMWARKRAAGEDPNVVFRTLPAETAEDGPVV